MKTLGKVITVLIFIIIIAVIAVGGYYLYVTTSNFKHMPRNFFVQIADEKTRYFDSCDNIRITYEKYTVFNVGYLINSDNKEIDYKVQIIPNEASELDYFVGNGLYEWKRAGDLTQMFNIQITGNCFSIKPKMHVDQMINDMYFGAKILRPGYDETEINYKNQFNEEDYLKKADLNKLDMFSLVITDKKKNEIKLNFAFKVKPDAVTLSIESSEGSVKL